MGIWPFGKKNDEEKKAQEKPAAQSEKPADPTSADAEAKETYTCLLYTSDAADE